VALERVDKFLLEGSDHYVWELFHENSKTSRHERHATFALHPSDAAIVSIMRRFRRVKPFTDFKRVDLPWAFPPTRMSFDVLAHTRETAREFAAGALQLSEVAKILFMSYGQTRDNVGSVYPRPFRIIPSGGALYPLELYLYAAEVVDLQRGLYHYDPEAHVLHMLPISAEPPVRAFVQQDLAAKAAVIVFVSAVFIRSTFKYGDRGYRFILLEAGHLAQNAMLTAHGLGLAAAPIGGYMDREVDDYLGIDGLNESTVYTLLVGQPVAPAPTGD
jgi:SagB-type dehydrogenase family enzyme